MRATVERMAHRLRGRRHERIARAVLATPPLAPRDDGVILFSMIGSRVLTPYLVAVKSLHRRLQRGRVAILDDGTLTPADRALLGEHLGDPQIVAIGAVDTGPCPRGGTWERLLTLLDLRREGYVIQLDSDTVTTGPVPEVLAAIAAGRSFTLRGGEDAELLPLAAVATRARGELNGHVQGAIEAALDRIALPGRAELRYVRGCSGFAGFAPGGDGRALAEAFSREAERLLGMRRWADWGSEQVTSNFVIANEPEPLLLPYERYFNYWNQPVAADSAFVHFVGTWRHHGGAYAAATRAALSELGA